MFISVDAYTLFWILQELFLNFFPYSFDSFSTVINRDVNGKKYLCNRNKKITYKYVVCSTLVWYKWNISIKQVFVNQSINKSHLKSIVVMRKLKITELNRISIEEFKEAEKLPLVCLLYTSDAADEL